MEWLLRFSRMKVDNPHIIGRRPEANDREEHHGGSHDGIQRLLIIDRRRQKRFLWLQSRLMAWEDLFSHSCFPSLSLLGLVCHFSASARP